MRTVGSIVLGLWLIPVALTAGPGVFGGPLVSIVAVDRIAYEHPEMPEWGVEAPQIFSRKAAFQVWRSGPVSRPLLVRYSLSGTASNGVDYEALSGEVTIPAGNRCARIIIHPIDDLEVERRPVVTNFGTNLVPNETVVLTLEASSAYRLGILQRAKAVIVDDDEPASTIGPDAQPPPFPTPYSGGGWGGSIRVINLYRDELLTRIRDDLHYVTLPPPTLPPMPPNVYRPAPALRP